MIVKCTPELRAHPLVKEWIKGKERQEFWREPDPDCKRCGWPHGHNLLCGYGSTFGYAKIGSHQFYVCGQSVDAYIKTVEEMNPLLLRYGVCFERVEEGIKVTTIENYNNWPQVKENIVPYTAWKQMLELTISKGA